MSDLSDFKRIVYEPQMESMRRLLAEKQAEVARLQHMVDAARDPGRWDEFLALAAPTKEEG